MILNQVTITGADDSISPHDLYQLSLQYPFVEWGILVSAKQEGGKRFPSQEWMYDLGVFKIRFEAETGLKLNASCHMCGSWVRDLLIGKQTFLEERSSWLDRFQRVQINTHAEDNPVVRKGFSESLQAIINHKTSTVEQFIIQMDGANNALLAIAEHANVLALPLHDLSHGTGLSPDFWPRPVYSTIPHVKWLKTGFAGGIGPDNIESVIQNINTTFSHLSFNIPSDTPYWIDMETKVRSDNDEKFDLDKVESCLDIASRFIAPN